MKKDKNFENNNSENEDVNIEEYYPNDDSLISDQFEADNTAFVLKEKERKKEIKKKSGRMTKGQITLVCVLSAIYLLILALAAWLIFYKPPVDSGEIPFDVTENTDNTDQTKDADKDASFDKGYSEVGETYNILLVGHDKLAHLADVTMIVNCNAKKKTVSVMQIPRDTYVACEYMTGKINAMYSTYYNDAVYAGSEDPYIDSLKEYTSLLEKNLCINIHYTAIINLDGFKNIVNALDGVDVYVPNAMKYNDPAQGLYIDIPAGPQHLDGDMAEGFVRFRSGYIQADIGRVNAQKIFLTALFSKVKNTVKSVDVSTLEALVNQIKENVHTDMTFSDIMYYAKLALKIDLEDITMMTIPGTVCGNYYVINRAATRDAINNYFNVYNKEISDNIFDHSRMFCDTDSDSISSYYYSDPTNVLDGTYTGDSIDQDSIYIPRT